MWEIYSRGVVPYVGFKNSEVFEKVNAGITLLPPQGTPADVSKLMKETWRLDPQNRPTFPEIAAVLSKVHGEEYTGVRSTSSRKSLPNRNSKDITKDYSKGSESSKPVDFLSAVKEYGSVGAPKSVDSGGQYSALRTSNADKLLVIKENQELKDQVRKLTQELSFLRTKYGVSAELYGNKM